MTNVDELINDIYNRSLEARKVVSKYIHHTPLDYSTTFSRMSGARVYLKYENLQKTGSFKVRGALYKLSKLVGKVEGVVAASAGNHAQGVAYAAKCFGMKAVIVMPEVASIAKVEATKGYGAEVVLYGTIYDEAEEKAREIARERGYEFIPAFDDPDIIAGQATLGHEILEDLEDVDVVVVPIGGGGLISGISVALRKKKPSIRIVGVEPANVPKFTLSLRAGHPVTVKPKPTVADGLAVKRPGQLTFRIIRELVDEVVTVTEDELSQAIYLLLERGKVLAEGAGAASLAAILSGKVRGIEGKKTVAVISGGNIDLTMLNRILVRGLAFTGRIATIYGYVPDQPGMLAKVATIIGKHRANILEVLHDRSDIQAPTWHTALRVIIEVPSREEVKKILEELSREGFEFYQISG
ncbi:threonine ammonia-lyase [Pyrofollis japonicus]|uniref:threonine ammonia-lyase n=1 Tax=Pyrofollis japonicus TaxID=3060460 RepID=UPI00295BC4EF|nr:threonine ammonia-lyase [Pyrofollis japonicus]BEP17186.1 threonine ammonia-lyase [Pyrofollis japonicus]